MVQLSKQKCPLATAGIYCTISPPLSDAMEDCSIVRVQQLPMLIDRPRCCMSASQHNECSVRCGTLSSVTSIGDRTFKLWTVWLINLCFYLCKRTVNPSSIAYYRLIQHSLTIFVVAVTIFPLLKNNPSTMTNFIIRMLFYDIYWLSVTPEHFSAWLYVYHCSTMRCVICAN